jgi:hypothetical protein
MSLSTGFYRTYRQNSEIDVRYIPSFKGPNVRGLMRRKMYVNILQCLDRAEYSPSESITV